MNLTSRLAAALMVRWLELTRPPNRDRGDSPVTTAIIIAGLAVLAVAVVAWAVTQAEDFMDTAPGGGEAP